MKKSILLSVLLLIVGCSPTKSSSKSLDNITTSSISSNSQSLNSLSSSTSNSIFNETREGYLMVSLPQDQIYYQVNETINVENIEIYLVYIDDYTRIKLDINEVNIDNVDMSNAGEKQVYVKYQSYSGYFTIYVGTKLNTPENIIINSLYNTITWSNVENTSKYQVRISYFSKEYGVYEVETNSFKYDEYNLLPGDYRFEVKSISNNVNYYDSDYSNFINIHVKEEGELEPLTNPSGLSDNVISFSWNANSLVKTWVINISNDNYSDEFEISGNITKIIYADSEHFNNLESGSYVIKIKALPKDTNIYSESEWSISSFRILQEGEKVKLGTPFGLVDAGTYAMMGYLANAKTFGVQIYTEEGVFIKEVETNGLTFEYKRDLQIEEGIYVLYIYAKGYDVFLDSDLYGPCKINYMEVE